MEHFITGITINKLHHLSNIEINLNKEHRQHLLLTGKNGSGKTSLLLDIQRYLKAINEDKLYKVLDDYKKSLDFYQQKLNSDKEDINRYECEKNYNFYKNQINNYCGGIELSFSSYTDIDKLYADGNFVTAFYPAERKANIEAANGVQEIKLDKAYGVEKDPGQLLLKYMVHLKTQQSYARNEGNISDVENIQMWFDRFERALRILLDEDSIKLQYDYKNYDFKIVQDGRVPFNFAELSDGYSSVIYIVSDLILRMDKNWLNENRISQYTEEGIVLIDELETHLHIELQKKILPFLTEFFPHIQFIVTTHSPYILNSVANAKAYDLEKHMELDNLYMYKADDLADANEFEFLDLLKTGKIPEDCKCLIIPTLSEDISDEERIKRAELRCQLKNALSKFPEGEARDMFEDIEKRRAAYDQN
mgnify:CR=1 FL=1